VLSLPPRWPSGRMLSLQMRALVVRVWASIQELADDNAVPRLTPEEQRMALPGVGCWSPLCCNVTTPAEDTLTTVLCEACGVAKYCSAACQRSHGMAHAAACGGHS